MPGKILLEKKSKYAIIYFNHPEGYNAFDLDMMTSFANCLVSLSTNPNIMGIIISGKGKAFSTGGDLKWGASYEGGAAVAFHELSSRFHQAILEIRNMAKPVIAAINGVAAGGGFSLALACDFRIMAKSAMLKQGYTSNGLTLDGGGTHTLPRLVGLSKALEIISFDEPMNSEKALALNLVNDVVDDDDVMNAAENMLQKISGVSPVSFGYTKQLLYQSFQTSFESQLESERRALSACAAGNDGKEGINAFLEKRKPEFNW